MMDWTNRHCRYFMRLLAPNALLFTEMVTAEALIHGNLDRLLGHDGAEAPLVLQLGGSQPERLALAVTRSAPWNFAEINLNVGCPSDRVQSGKFGACLMAEPTLVAECCQAMMAETALPITVKCRIGIDNMDKEAGLDAFVDEVAAAGVKVIYLHARKAWLNGLSPKENRSIPRLDYDRARRLAIRRPDLSIILNGGLNNIKVACAEMTGFDGLMIGRGAYRTPYLLAELEQIIFGAALPQRHAVAHAMADYADNMSKTGVPLHSITRHMLGLYAGQSGAKQWRRHFGETARLATDAKTFIMEATNGCEAIIARCAA
jgi:tRNA-dihydrouridine synthase A